MLRKASLYAGAINLNLQRLTDSYLIHEMMDKADRKDTNRRHIQKMFNKTEEKADEGAVQMVSLVILLLGYTLCAMVFAAELFGFDLAARHMVTYNQP